MSKTIPPTVTLEMVYNAVQDVADGIAESRSLWGEAEKNILRLISEERRRTDMHEHAIEELRIEDQDHGSQIRDLRKSKHQHANMLTAHRIELDELKERLAKIEGQERHDTELRPPPPSEPPEPESDT